MCAVQGNFSFYRKGTGKLLSAEYAVAAALSEMPLEKKCSGGKRRDQIRDYLRSLRQARSRAVSAESRALGFVQGMFSGEQIENAHGLKFYEL